MPVVKPVKKEKKPVSSPLIDATQCLSHIRLSILILILKAGNALLSPQKLSAEAAFCVGAGSVMIPVLMMVVGVQHI